MGIRGVAAGFSGGVYWGAVVLWGCLFGLFGLSAVLRGFTLL